MWCLCGLVLEDSLPQRDFFCWFSVLIETLQCPHTVFCIAHVAVLTQSHFLYVEWE